MTITPAQIHEGMNLRVTTTGERLSGLQANSVYHMTWCDVANGEYVLYGHDRDGKNHQIRVHQDFVTMCCVELTPEQMPESVMTICYRKEDVWPDKECAMFFYRDCINNSEGAELTRYINVYLALEDGAKVADDGVCPYVI